MLHPTTFRRSRLSLRRCSTLFHGRALRLPPSPLPIAPRPARTGAALYPIAAGLRPFQRHLYRQRALVTLIRALTLAALVATATLALRILGLALPLPAAPLAAAGLTLVAGLSTLPWQAPSEPQLAHEIDRRLGLRERIASALELEREDRDGHEDGPDPAGLRQRALAFADRTLRAYTPSGLLPWPSLRREAYGLSGLTALVAATALVAVYTPLPRPTSIVAGARTVTARHQRLNSRAPRAGNAAAPIKILSIGSVNGLRPTTAAARNGRVNAGVPIAKGAQGGRPGGVNGPRLIAGKGAAQGSGGRSGQGTPGRSTEAGGRGTTGATGAGAHSSGTGRQLSLSSGRNSSAGGVESPQQRALKSLQSSIQSAQAQANGATGANRGGGQGGANGQGAAGNSANNPNGQGANNAPNTGTGAGQQGAGKAGAGRQGTGKGTGRRGAGLVRAGSNGGQSGANGRKGQGATGVSNTGAPDGYPGLSQSGQGSQGAQGGDPALGRRGGQAGGGRGADSGAGASQTAKGDGRTALSHGRDITLNGAPGQGGHLVFSVGQPSRAGGTGESAPSGGTSGAAVSVPGYVAPDSNTITPDDRSVVQGYFTPVNGQ